jgi:hypothetical protein
MVIKLTKDHLQRLKKLVIDQMDYAGDDNDRPEFDEWRKLLRALEDAED